MEGNKKCSRDVISTLPDNVRCRILAFLTTKEAALALFLSKRWSNLLQLVPILDFDDSASQHSRVGPKRILVFKMFVDSVLKRRFENSSSPVKKVSLRLSNEHIRRHVVIGWIQKIMDHGALELTLRFDYDRVFTLPFKVLTSQALVHLRIGSRIRLLPPRPDSVSPMLNSLVLDSVDYVDATLSLEPILSTFPNLHNLRIHESKEWYYWDGSVSSQTLERLVYRRDDDSSSPKPCVTFDTPGLVYLEYSDVVADKYENLRLDSLVEVRLDLQLTGDQILRKNAAKDSVGYVPGDVSKLFTGIKNVKILCLSPNALDTLYYRGGRSILVFNNLICLSLGSDRPYGGSPYIFWRLLPYLLLSSINLQTLIIKGLVHYAKQAWEGVWIQPISWDDVSESLSSCGVKVLQISGYEGTGEELSHMERFLGKLSRLEMVRVTHEGVDDGERRRLVNDLLLLPKASPKCMVQVVEESA
ncbi:hypothetical protein Bca4012_084811 [Brassica carinata]|uniref:FBD domain-containing protein n=1 Tax=Brassica carinata TaxID=52824 RepID=A0A8X7V8G5_BRACI|nr:hypothetical protein Bca52824_025720 [Brassica carinata]